MSDRRSGQSFGLADHHNIAGLQLGILGHIAILEERGQPIFLDFDLSSFRISPTKVHPVQSALPRRTPRLRDRVGEVIFARRLDRKSVV